MRSKLLKLSFLAVLICLLASLSHVNASTVAKLKIVTQPQSVTVDSGEDATLKVVAQGEGLTYKWYYKNAGKTKFSVSQSFTFDTYTVPMTSDKSGRQVYCLITDKNGNSVKTDTVTISQRQPLKIVTQPKSVTVKNGATAKVTVSAQGTNIKYKWYYKDAGSTKFALTTSFTGNSYSIKMSDARAGREVYCVITDDLGNSVMTNVVSLNMQSLKILTQPQSITVKESEVASVKVTAKGTNLTYKWYVKDAGNSEYSLDKNQTTGSYNVSMTPDVSGRFVYCVITDAYGNSAKSEEVFLLMEPTLGPVITQQPQDPICSIGETVKISVQAEGTALHYQWQYSTDGKTWKSLGKTTSTCSLKATETAFKRLYRCRVYDDYGFSRVTETVKMMDESALILSQPKNWTGSLSGTVFFQMDVLDSVTSCQWQSSTNGGSTWTNCGSNAPFYSTTATEKRCGYLYRCIVTDAEGRTQTSDIVTIAIDSTFQITSQPQNVTARLGEEVVFLTQASGQNVTFKWQRSDDGKTWSAVGSAKARITQTLQKFTVSKYYRCIVTNGDGTTLTSDVVQLKWANTGFFTEDGKVYYVKQDGTIATGLQTIDGNTYIFSDSGIMLTGMKKYNGKIYYLKPNGAAATGFTYVPELSNTLYFKADGSAAIGWTEISGKKYYFYETGEMAWGVTQIGGNEYYFNTTTGAQTSGFVQVGPTNYMYFPSGATAPFTGLKTISGQLYYFAPSGSNRGITQSYMQTVNGKTYYFDPYTKAAITGFLEYNDHTYYFGSDYVMVKNKLIDINGKTYYFDSNGEMAHGLVRFNGNRYYFDPATGAALHGWIQNNNNWLYFDPTTHAAYFATSGTKCVTINGLKYLFNTNGHILTGVRKVGDVYYYFAEPNQFKTGMVEVNSRKYYVNSTQKVATGLKSVNGKLYLFSSAGAMQTGWRKASNNYYYFSENTGAAASGWQTIITGGVARRTYLDPKTFRAATGLKKIDGKTYYFGTNCWAASGKRKVDGVTYYFAPVTFEAYTGWVKNSDGTHSYYNGAKGLLTGPGTFKIDGKSYTISAAGVRQKEKSTDPKQHKLACTWGKIDGVKCYYGMNGKPVTGLCVIGEKLYYFDSNGKIKTGSQKIDGSYYYFTQSGATTGAKTISKKQYYYSTYTARRVYGLQEISGAFRFYNSSGVLITGLYKDGTDYYYYDPTTGSRTTGFVTVGEKQYYFDPVTGKAKTGHLQIDGMNYYFDPTTAQRKYGPQMVGDELYCFTKTTSDAGLAKGLTVVNGKTYYLSEYNGQAMGGYRLVDDVMYYFDPTTFEAVSGIRRVPNGAAYLFNATGGVKTGWQTVGGKTYYFYPTTGEMAEGLASVQNNLHYFDFNNGLLRSSDVTVGGVTYRFDSNGNGTATGSSKLAAAINKGIAYFEKGYGNEGKVNDPSKVTCSQLMIAVCESLGVTLPERSGQQYTTLLQEYDVEIVESLAQAQAGDLVFFSTVNCAYAKECDFWNELHHVAMYMGEGKILGSYEIKGDTDNNGPMVKNQPTDSPSAVIYSIVRINGIK